MMCYSHSLYFMNYISLMLNLLICYYLHLSTSVGIPSVSIPQIPQKDIVVLREQDTCMLSKAKINFPTNGEIHLSHSFTKLINNPPFPPASNISYCVSTYYLSVVHHLRVSHFNAVGIIEKLNDRSTESYACLKESRRCHEPV